MALEDIARRLVDTDARTVLIDGRSGSGKSTLAALLAELWDGSVVVTLDDIYPGWDGLAWATEHLRAELLAPRARGAAGRWRRWDWAADAPAEWHTVSARQRLIVEGAGTLTAANRALADLGIWIDADDSDRKRRALLRDGDTYRPHWERWARQEDDFVAIHRPRAVADEHVTNAPGGWRWTT
ncbi:hypothetical protein ACQI4F_06785 [Mycolicibacterium vaccae]|uniref:hypothetical protein n=1 Tax=Mycolicibacterium vaccae TaxID=1810 RepID=UPI003CE8B00C